MFGSHALLPINGTIPENVYIEDTTGLNPLATNYLVASPLAPTSAASAVSLRMRQMAPGVDYSIDRLRGIITFVNPIPDAVSVAIDFTLQDGTRLSSLVRPSVAVLIKDKVPQTPQLSQEIKRFYNLGDRNIVRDNGLGNFSLKVLDKDRVADIGATLTPPQRYPDNINMTFETGIFEIRNPLPFDDVYASNVDVNNPLHAVFSVEYQSIVRTFTLRPNIVIQSETVEVNGRKVTRDLDYFIDYDIGIITFFNEDLIRESTVIDITYEFAPFGGILGETLVGARGTYDIAQNVKSNYGSLDNWSAGSTVLYDFAAKPTGPPDVRSTPESLLVTEGDTQLKGLRLGQLPFKTNMSLEAARSEENPDLYGKAIIDSMEGIKQEDSSPMLKTSWVSSANPAWASSPFPANLVMNFQGRDNPSSDIRWTDVDVSADDQSAGLTTQKALQLSYNLNTQTSQRSEQVSVINVISLAGRDFSKKTNLEVEIEGAGAAGANVEMVIDYGSFNEDSDGDGKLETEDVNGDGVLNLGEDIGYTFHGAGPDLIPGTADDTVAQIGAGNGLLDTEDLNLDHVLETEDLPATFTPLFSLSSSQGQVNTAGVRRTDLNFSDRELFEIPLNISGLSAEEQARLTGVKQVRVTIRNNSPTASPQGGTIRLVRLTMVGNTYEPATVTGALNSTMTVSAVNNKDDAAIYTSPLGNPAYNDLYKDALPSPSAKEQSLALIYDLQPASTGTTRNLFSVARDFSKHDYFRFFLSKPSGCVNGAGCVSDKGKVFLQVGSETDYQQATIDMSNVPAAPNWKLVSIKQADLNSDGTPDTWISDDPTVVVTQVGAAPNLTQVAQIKIGVLNDTAAEISHQVWIDEIHVAEPHNRIGHAKRYSFDSTWAKWMDFGGSYRSVDRNWQTPTTAITNQDSTQSNAFFNLNRISFMPMTFKTTHEVSVTPSAFRSNQNGLVSFFDEGRVEHVGNVSTAKLIIPKLPLFDVSYANDTTQNTITQRTEISDIINVGATYSPRSTFNILPTKFLTFRPLPTSITFLHMTSTTKLRFPGLNRLVDFNISTAPFDSTDLTQFSDENEMRLAFKPWNGFSFNPTYKLRVDKERRDFRDDEKEALPSVTGIDQQVTPRATAQTITAAGNLKIFKWLDPRYNYSMTGTETNGLPTQSDTTAYALKTITRNSQGEVSGAVQVNQLLPNFRPLNSMNFNTSYKLENGDTYNNMPQDFSWRNQLWVGKPLSVADSTGTDNVATRVDSTDRRTFRTNIAWQPWSAYKIENRRLKPLTSLSLTSNYLKSVEDGETTGTTRHVESTTFPDLIVTINNSEKFFNVQRVIDNSRLVFKTNKRLTETKDVSRSTSLTWGTDYQFQFLKKFDFSTTYNKTTSQDDNLVTDQLTQKTDTVNYSIQTRIPVHSWAYTPRYERDTNFSHDSIQQTNDLVEDIFSLQIYGDISKPLGIRLGRKEIGLANRVILNSTLKWDKKRSAVNPATNYEDVYSGTLSGDYTISQNFRLAIGGNYSQEVHHPDFKTLDTTTFGINSTLTIQF